MKRVVVAALAAVVWLVGCGGGASLPTEPGPQNPQLPEEPLQPGNPSGASTLWPLTQGSTWTYRIDDPQKGVFDKRVEVVGQQTVPGTTMTATAVRSVQPYLEELSWQVELQSGLVVRLREEDLKDGKVVRSTTWSPATVKSLAQPQNVGWSYSSSIQETVRMDDGTVDEKDRTYVWRVVAVNETVVVPAGTFTNAIKVLRDRPDKAGKERVYWLVPGIGKVKEDGERLEELTSYDVRK
ncbi:hypothetical protein [Hyalangium gracile]|uniref:hypothetical protein n=1 Tax=Hyalangium gracile TaxID=394092 RepID=UPI001CCE2717|nr:hypothetical protein [Hyalangium gracile]